MPNVFCSKLGCHCISQGKIGSGFDISVAVYGSQIYSKFNTSYLLKISENFRKGQISEDLIKDIEKEYLFFNAVGNSILNR